MRRSGRAVNMMPSNPRTVWWQGLWGASGRARALNADGLVSAHGRSFSGDEVHLLRKRWNIPTVKINRTEHNPRQWPDGTYSVQGAAEALSISTQTVFKWLQKGRLSGHQITKGMPWQINLSNTQIVELRTQVRRTTLSKKEAS